MGLNPKSGLTARLQVQILFRQFIMNFKEEEEKIMDETIREKAYYLWEQAGRPETDGVEFWLQAEKLLSESN